MTTVTTEATQNLCRCVPPSRQRTTGVRAGASVSRRAATSTRSSTVSPASAGARMSSVPSRETAPWQQQHLSESIKKGPSLATFQLGIFLVMAIFWFGDFLAQQLFGFATFQFSDYLVWQDLVWPLSWFGDFWSGNYLVWADFLVWQLSSLARFSFYIGEFLVLAAISKQLH